MKRQDLSPSFVAGAMLLVMLALFVASALGLYLALRSGQLAPLWSDALVYAPGLDGFARYPWGIISYPWMHQRGETLVVNALILWLLAQQYERLGLSGWRYLLVFVLGSLAGALCYSLCIGWLSYLLSGATLYGIIGPSAGICALAFYIGCLHPRRRICLGGRYRINFLLFISLCYALSVLVLSDNIGGGLAHLGGAIAGALGALWQRRHSTQTQDPSERERILDKLRNSGYKSLSNDEKDYLHKL